MSQLYFRSNSQVEKADFFLRFFVAFSSGFGQANQVFWPRMGLKETRDSDC
jgi:hypothetical protein